MQGKNCARSETKPAEKNHRKHDHYRKYTGDESKPGQNQPLLTAGFRNLAQSGFKPIIPVAHSFR